MKYLILYLPFILSLFQFGDPQPTFIIAWLGSFFIFYISLTGKIKELPKDLPFIGQMMRPIILTQLIFAGFMAIGSIFYFLDANGFYYLTADDHFPADRETLALLAKCQQLYCLGHAGVTHGILINMNYTKPRRFSVKIKNSLSNTLIFYTLIFTGISLLVKVVPGLEQLQLRMTQLSYVASVICFAQALPEKNLRNILIAGSIFVTNILGALYSGMKEELLIPLILLFVFLYPHYKKIITLLAPLVLAFYFYYVPAYNSIIRQESWFGSLTAEEASDLAIERIQAGDVDIGEINWEFLTGRLSEIEMFTKYASTIPAKHPYFGFDIVMQAFETLIPRVVYPDKPITEELVMERAYLADVFNRNATGSAKPFPIVDGYLSAGFLGAWLACFIIGFAASYISVKAEFLFGGYLFGSGLIYTGLFQIFWRGNCFEFMFNAVVWSYVIMYFLFYTGRKFGLILDSSLKK